MGLLDKKFKLKHIAAAGFACIGLFAISYGMIEATNQTSFCGTSCHEMDPMYQTWMTSNHKTVDCADCHEQPGLTGTIKSKWKGTQELILHVTGNVPDPIKLQNTNEVNCYVCHQDKIKGQELALERKDPHTERHFQEGMNCVSCHTGLVHNESLNKVLPSRDRCYTCHLDAMSSLVRRD